MNYYTDVLRKYAVFQGRASRKEYWMFMLVNIIIVAILVGLGVGLSALVDQPEQMFPWTMLVVIALLLIYNLAIFIPSLAVAVRRLHDTDRSGWWILVNLVPYIGGFVFLIFMVIDSKPGDNRFGPNPKGIQNPQ